jgi:hypothetical protein
MDDMGTKFAAVGTTVTNVSGISRFSVDISGNIYGLDSGNHVFRNGLLAERPGQLLLEEMVKGLIQINSITHKVLC